MSDFKVGDRVFIFDENRRIYDKNSPDWPSPVYREHFRLVTITGETKMSWLVGQHRPVKYSKRTCTGLYTAEQVEEKCWVKNHRHNIANAVHSVPFEKLKQIAEIVGYKP